MSIQLAGERVFSFEFVGSLATLSCREQILVLKPDCTMLIAVASSLRTSPNASFSVPLNHVSKSLRVLFQIADRYQPGPWRSSY